MTLRTTHTIDASLTAPLDAATEASLKKRWLYLLPAIFITYSLAYLDRANYGFGAAAGLANTLHITDKDTSLLGGLFFLGYFAFQIPGAILAKKFSVRRVVFVALLAWGILAALTGILREFWLLAIDRLLLGVAESLVLPVMLHLLTGWFTRSERARANTVLILGNPVTVLWMSAITGWLIQRFGWQNTFILEGIPCILWAFLWLLLVRDKPSEARWLTPGAAEVLESHLSQEQLQITQHSADPHGTSSDLRLSKALLRPDILLLSLQYFCWSLGVYGFVLWLPTIVRKGSGLSMTKTGLLSALPYLAAILLMLLVSWIADARNADPTRNQNHDQRHLVWPFLLVAGIALFGSYAFASRSFPLALLGLIIGGGCMYAPYGPFFALVPQLIPRSVTAEAFALINSFGALGGFFGSYFVGLLQAITGNSRAGYLLMSLSLIASAIILLFLRRAPQPETNTFPLNAESKA